MRGSFVSAAGGSIVLEMGVMVDFTVSLVGALSVVFCAPFNLI